MPTAAACVETRPEIGKDPRPIPLERTTYGGEHQYTLLVLVANTSQQGVSRLPLLHSTAFPIPGKRSHGVMCRGSLRHEAPAPPWPSTALGKYTVGCHKQHIWREQHPCWSPPSQSPGSQTAGTRAPPLAPPRTAPGLRSRCRKGPSAPWTWTCTRSPPELWGSPAHAHAHAKHACLQLLAVNAVAQNLLKYTPWMIAQLSNLQQAPGWRVHQVMHGLRSQKLSYR